VKRAQSLKLGASAQMIPIILGYGSNLLCTPFVVAVLGLHDFGVWALSGALAQYGVLLDLGVSRAITRFVAIHHAREERESERAVIGGCVLTILVMGGVLMLLPLCFHDELGRVIGASPDVARTLLTCSIVILITGLLGAMMTAASVGRGRMVAANIGLAIQKAAVVVAGVIALVISPSLTSFAVGGTVGLLVVLVTIAIDEGTVTIGMPRRDVFPELISFGLKGQALAVCEIVLFQSGKLLAGVVVGPAAAGAYELGSRLALGARAFGTSASTVLSAHLTRAFAVDGIEAIRENYRRLVTRNAAVSNFALFFLAATSASVVPLWLGSANAEVTVAIAALSLTYAANVTTGVTSAAAYALNHMGTLVASAVISSALAVGLALPLAYVAGLTGILVGMAIAIAIATVIGVQLVHRRIEMPLSDFFVPVGGPSLLGIVSMAVSAPIGFLMEPQTRESAIIPFLGTAAVFSVVYMTAGWRLKYLPDLPIPDTFRARFGTKSLTESD
jgi:O-antigen/teichoic acid export membrane protein